MDDRQFDRLTRLFAAGAPRRTLLRGFFGIGLGAAGGSAGSAADARTVGTRPTIPPPAAPACKLPKQMCGGECCEAGKCKSGHCCPGATDVWCGSACCESGLCTSSGDCCDEDEQVCGSTCCSASASCARDGNHDFCCDPANGGSPCGKECCDDPLQCCDRECCGNDAVCLARVFGGGSGQVREEICCPRELACASQCCSGECYDPEGALTPAGEIDSLNPAHSCCPAGFAVCDNPDGSRSCVDPAAQCCSAADCPAIEENGEIACWTCVNNMCAAVLAGEQGGCDECQICDSSQSCVANTQANGQFCGGSESGSCCANGVCSACPTTTTASPETFLLSVVKWDDQAEPTPLAGACFRLYPGVCGPTGNPLADQCVGDGTGGTELGTALFPSLPPGDYCLEEYQAPPNFTASGPINVEVITTTIQTVRNTPMSTSTTDPAPLCTPEGCAAENEGDAACWTCSADTCVEVQNSTNCFAGGICCFGTCCSIGAVCVDGSTFEAGAAAIGGCCRPETCESGGYGGSGQECGAAVDDFCLGTINCPCRTVGEICDDDGICRTPEG
ncbi:MAG: hypothetical protein KF883_02080 [Thermomicrobiales bacterium]|nr:hypothetical protein [Thermomicrobiales bacterium]